MLPAGVDSPVVPGTSTMSRSVSVVNVASGNVIVPSAMMPLTERPQSTSALSDHGPGCVSGTSQSSAARQARITASSGTLDDALGVIVSIGDDSPDVSAYVSAAMAVAPVGVPSTSRLPSGTSGRGGVVGSAGAETPGTAAAGGAADAGSDARDHHADFVIAAAPLVPGAARSPTPSARRARPARATWRRVTSPRSAVRGDAWPSSCRSPRSPTG
jgi:hypothetical protein